MCGEIPPPACIKVMRIGLKLFIAGTFIIFIGTILRTNRPIKKPCSLNNLRFKFKCPVTTCQGTMQQRNVAARYVSGYLRMVALSVAQWRSSITTLRN